MWLGLMGSLPKADLLSSFNDRLLQLKCAKEYYRGSFLPAAVGAPNKKKMFYIPADVAYFLFLLEK